MMFVVVFGVRQTSPVSVGNTNDTSAAAFALAMVIYSAGMKEAMLTGICLIFGDVLQCVLRQWFGDKYNKVLSALTAIVTGVSVYGMFVLSGLTPETWQLLGMGVLAVLMVKHDEGRKGTPDFDDVLFSGSVAYGLYVLVAALREYLAGAKIFGFELFQAEIVSASSEDAVLWVGLPVYLVMLGIIYMVFGLL